MVIIPILIAIALIILFYQKTNPPIDNNKKIVLIILRSATVSLIILLLFNPIIKFKNKKIIKKEPIILTDISQSMAQKYAEKEKSDYFNDIQKKLSNTRKINFANGIDGDASSTAFKKTLTQLKSITPFENISSIIMLSDGWFSDDNIDFIKNLNVPIYTFAPDINEKGYNLSISKINYNKTGYVNESNPIIANVSSENYTGKAVVSLYFNNKKLAEKNVDFSKSSSKKVAFHKTFSKTGLYNFEVKIFPQKSEEPELISDDNKIAGAIRILKKKAKILIITDKLSWDIHYINQSLKQNNRWKINTIVYQKDFFNGRKPIKLKNEFKSLSNLIIINNGKLRFKQNQITLIKNFVRNGGGLLFCGQPINSLSEYLPIKGNYFASKEKTSIIFTDESKNYTSFDITNINIPPLDYVYVNPQIQSKVLAVFENEEKSPAILFKKYGKGKILYFAFLNLWRWQMWDKNDKYKKFMRDITLWLQTTDIKRFTASTSKNGYLPGEEVKIKLLAYDEKLTPLKNMKAKILIKNKQTMKSKEGYLIETDDGYIYSNNFVESGKYTFDIFKNDTKKIASGSFLIYDSIPESHDYGFNSLNLKYISKVTNGKFSLLKDKDFIIKEITELTQTKEIIKIKEIPIYKKIYFVLIFIFCFTLELYLRKKWGLI